MPTRQAEDMTEIKKEAGPEELSDEKIEKTTGGEAAEKPLDYRRSINSSNKVDEFSLKS